MSVVDEARAWEPEAKGCEHCTPMLYQRGEEVLVMHEIGCPVLAGKEGS